MVIGICGKKRSGKDTIADYLVENNNFSRYSFADPLKKGVMEMFGFTNDQMWGSREDKETIDPRWGISPRQALQVVGTELLQFEFGKHLTKFQEKIGRQIWVKKFEYWYQENNVNVVIPDVRFVHEIETIKNLGGQIWKIDRDGVDTGDEHASENEWMDRAFDFVVNNNGTLTELYHNVNGKLK